MYSLLERTRQVSSLEEIDLYFGAETAFTKLFDNLLVDIQTFVIEEPEMFDNLIEEMGNRYYEAYRIAAYMPTNWSFVFLNSLQNENMVLMVPYSVLKTHQEMFSHSFLNECEESNIVEE